MTGCEGQDCSKCLERLKCLTSVFREEDKKCYSEFGKGFITCLIKFAEHAMMLGKQLEHQKYMREKNHNLFTDESAVQLWANGASDHLYELEVPPGEDWDEIRKKVRVLKDLGLDMGHGFRNKYTREEAFKLLDSLVGIAMMIDKKLGLKPLKGKW